jgi:hypothetical protein
MELRFKRNINGKKTNQGFHLHKPPERRFCSHYGSTHRLFLIYCGRFHRLAKGGWVGMLSAPELMLSRYQRNVKLKAEIFSTGIDLSTLLVYILLKAFSRPHKSD